MAIIIEPLTCYKEELNMQLQCIYKSDINRNINDNKCKVADAYRNLTKEVLDIAAREKARFRNDGSR